MTLEVQNLTRRFGRMLALDGASLDAGAGEVVALLGPSGCGKTTTLRIVAGFETADSGSVWLGGRDLARLPPHGRDIGLVFQDYALFPHMTVADNIAYGLRRRGRDAAARAARVDAMLDLVRLSGLGARRPAQLSGGQQQRVALARALAIEPQLLLLDEPLSNLDAKLRGALQAELRGILTRVGTTTLIVTHDQEEAMALADRIAIMSQGRVLQLGTAREVYERPACRFVAEFLGSALWLEGRVEPGGFVTARGTALACAPPSRIAPRHGLLVRPEALRIGAAPEGWNALSAQVTGARYRGAVTLLDLLVDGAAPASIELERGTSPPPPGATLALAAAPADCILVPEDAGG